MGPVPPESDSTSGAHRQAHAGSPAEPVVVSGHRLDRDARLDPRQPRQLLGDARRLQAPLRGRGHVLEVAAAATARAGVGARRLHPVGRRGEDLNRVGPQVGRGGARDPGTHALAGQRVADEDDLPVGRPGHAAATARHRAGFELEQRSCLVGIALAGHVPGA